MSCYPLWSKTAILGYFLIIELVQNVIGLTIKQTVCQKKAKIQIMEANATGFLSNMLNFQWITWYNLKHELV